jgi:uncharacterized protein YndB with AHSA1/START domain
MNNDQNVIERQIEIKADQSKVWRALTDSKQFGQWFKASFESEFVAGRTTKGQNKYPGYEFELQFHVREITPETYFAYAWRPSPIDKNFDYSKEQPTLVEFFLSKTADGTLVKVKESGWDKITASRRAEAYKSHTGGWEAQLKNIEKFLVEK